MTNTSSNSNTLVFDDGAVQLRQRLVVSILACRPLLIRNIRADDVLAPGLRKYEVSFLRLLDSMTNGSRLEINATGTQLRFVPGVLMGGEIHHDCPVDDDDDTQDASNRPRDHENNKDATSSLSNRSIGWFLEGILPLAPFGKEPLHVHFTGITDGTCHIDPSVDYLMQAALPLMKFFGVGVDSFDADVFSPQPPRMLVQRRGAAPSGGGLVEVYVPCVKTLQSIDYTDSGKITRIRGSCISTRVVSNSAAARVAYAAKGLLLKLLPDVWISADAHTIKRHQCGPDPSLSCVLWSLSNTGVILVAEQTRTYEKQLPEDLGVAAAAALLEEVRRGGCIDTHSQSLALLWMLLTPEDVSRIRLGTLSQYTIESLRLFKRVFGGEFKIVADQETKTVLLSCLGTGYRNMAKASS
ncbi:hypothetical protein MPSEU_000555000 [Mayamaea pseudoterrestris]|nr:hypothetical protein MPSEU_000555000 [Mayamaea pseudoterrestris]